MSHSSSSDNALWSFGRTLAVVTTGVIGTLLAQPFALMFAMLLPVIAGLPWIAYLPAILFLTAGSLTLIGLVTAGLLPSLAACREFFADRAALGLVGADALPYEGTQDSRLVGTITDEWQMATASPDRRLHAIGVAPATDALAAFAISTWVMVRTIILMVDYSQGIAAAAALDLCCFISLAVMLQCMPKPVGSARRRGLIGWLLLILIAGLVGSLFSEIRSFSAAFGATQFVTSRWLMDLALPPTLGAIVIVWLRRPSTSGETLIEVDKVRPGLPGIWQIALFLFALPSVFASYAIGAFALLNSATTLGSWSLGELGDRSTFLQNAIGLPIAIAFLWLVARNMTRRSTWAYTVELVCAAFVVGFTVYLGLVLTDLPRSTPLAASGPPIDVPSAEATLLSFPSGPVSVASAAFVGLLLLLAGPSWARYRLRRSDEQRLGG